MTLEFRLLGPLEIRRQGARVPLRAPKQRLLLADLLLHAGTVVSVDTLLDDLWGTAQPARARHALEAHVSKLRHVLGVDPPLLAEPPGYRLEIGPGALDTVWFEQLLAEARDAQAASPERAASRAAGALALWRGPALADFRLEDFARPTIAHLEDLRLEALEERIEAELALGLAPELVGELQTLVAEHPLRERLVGQLMLALYRSGRGPEALAIFRSTRAGLVEELGLEPGPELREREREILRQDPSLTAAPADAPRRRTRRLVTVVAIDPVAPLDLDAEAHELELDRAAGAIAAVAADHDALCAEPFVLVLTQEDHAARAGAAALAARDAVALPLRVGIESGDALLTGASASGPVVSLARSLAARAADGAILVGPLAARLAEPAAELEPTATTAFELVSVDVAAPSVERRLDGPFVGRVAELRLLGSLLAADGARAALVLGPPGIGKSRLARELARAVDARVAVAHCSPYGATALAPLEQLAAQLGEQAAIAEVPAAEVPSAFRRLCEAAAAGGRLLVVVDDVQWADELVLDAIEHLAARGDGRILLLCLARHEVLDERPTLLAAGERIVLDALPAVDAEELAARLAPADAAVRSRAVDAAEGNPLFLEHFVAHAADVFDEIPPTLRSLLAARLDLLGGTERATIEGAAVVGRDFDAATLAELLDVVAARRALATLARRGLIETAPASAAFEEAFRFRHGLIREIAYDSATKAERARLHERLADLLAARRGEAEVVGFHLERAAALRPERDRHARRLAEDAGRCLGTAGIAGWKRGDAGAASRLLARAVALLPAEDEQRRELLCELGIALNTAGESEAADEVLREAITAARDRRIELRAGIELAGCHLLDDPVGAADRLLALAEHAIPIFRSLDDHRSLGRTLMLTGWVRGGMYCENAAWQDAAERALSSYRSAGWPPATCVGHIAAAVYHGPTPAPDGIDGCRQLLEHDVDDRAAEANVLAYLGGLVAMCGDPEEATAHVERATRIYADLGRRPTIASTCAPVAAGIHLLGGDLEAAEHVLRESCRVLESARNRNALATQAARLADVVYCRGRLDEAETWLELAARCAVADDVASQVAVRSVRAKLLAASDELEEAEALARDAVDRIAATDALNDQAQALLDLAEVLGRCGRTDEAAAVGERALDLFERKGNRAAARAARGTPRTASPGSAPLG